jgi:hypothetical protein
MGLFLLGCAGGAGSVQVDSFTVLSGRQQSSQTNSPRLALQTIVNGEFASPHIGQKDRASAVIPRP